MRVKQIDRIEGGAAWAGRVHPTLALGVSAALTVTVKQTDRTKVGTTGTGGVLLPLAPGVATAPSVGFKQVGRSKGGTAETGGVLFSSTYCSRLILVQYFYFQYRAIIVQIIWDC
ncbi:hypothetical protein E1189_02800 [Sansalvadorimonas verongulae]|nr:hypothetical protein [Sansalvadorimonas verongulae]